MKLEIIIAHISMVLLRTKKRKGGCQELSNQITYIINDLQPKEQTPQIIKPQHMSDEDFYYYSQKLQEQGQGLLLQDDKAETIKKLEKFQKFINQDIQQRNIDLFQKKLIKFNQDFQYNHHTRAYMNQILNSLQNCYNESNQKILYKNLDQNGNHGFNHYDQDGQYDDDDYDQHIYQKKKRAQKLRRRH